MKRDVELRARTAGVDIESALHIAGALEHLQVFNPQGKILMAFGQEGTRPGQFWLPAGVFVDGRDRIYVADSFNKRIQIFELLEKVER